MDELRWHWRNCREIGFTAQFYPLYWRLRALREVGVCGGQWWVNIGPFIFTLSANIGNASSENRFEAWLGLPEEEAIKRAVRLEGGRLDG